MTRARLIVLLLLLALMRATSGEPALCDTDSDCAARFGWNGDPE